MKRHDLLEKKVEKAESILSAKAEAKETVQREVYIYIICMYMYTMSSCP